MRLVYNRFTVAVLVALAVVTLCATLIGVLAVSAKPVQAACGSVYLETLYCKSSCYQVDYSCPGGAVKTRCYLDEIEKRNAPFSYKLVGWAGSVDYCYPVSPNCPTYCTP
jgi:hypothetical protein